MRHASVADLVRAFERAAAAGGPDDPRLEDPAVAQAWSVLQARRSLLGAERCPPAVLRRVQGFFASRPRGALRLVLEPVFDSRAAATPAYRGFSATPRTLRFAGGGATVDVQVRPAGEGTRSLYVAVSPPRPGLEMRVQVLPRGTRRRAILDPSGTARVDLPGRAHRAQLTFHVAGGETFRIDGVSLD